MRWKLFFGLLFVGALAAGGAVGWYHIQTARRLRDIEQKLEIAKRQIESGNHPRAQANLQLLLDENPNLQGADAILSTLARSYETTNDADKALASWRTIVEKYPDSQYVDNGLAALGEKQYSDGQFKKAAEYWNLILTRYKDSDSIPDAELGRARLAYHTESLRDAQVALLDWLERHPDSERRDVAERSLGKINLEGLYSAEMGEGDQLYNVRRGDTLETIGRQFRVSPDLIRRANRIRDTHTLSVGKRLKIPKTDFSIEVDKTENTLLLLNDGRFFKRYRVRTGKDDWRTPVGEYRVLRKVKNPTWNNPEDGKTYPPGDPENQLGTRWLAFEGSLGIHGTIDPSTIGQYASNGCVGMLKEDVEELYDLVPVGTPVKITGKMVTRGQKNPL
ncbi:L,D-transpeptidase family protein [Candidatus Sumerlaeota bacterium]|nr:L,D-transpeptidase family protein [Candidatus Sumerlaeota bacterium]